METSDKKLIDNTPIGVKKPKKMSAKKVAAIALGGVVIFIAIILIIANIATNAPLKISDEFISDIQNDKATAAYDLMSTDAKTTITASEFTKTVDKISPYLTGEPNLQSKEANTSTESGTTAKIVYEIKGSDATYTITVSLVENNGKWQVQTFESKLKK